MARVVRRVEPVAQGQIITRTLLLDPDPGRGEPGERIEPMQRTGHAAEHSDHEVATLHMRQLMQNNHLETLLGPRFRTPG